MIHRRGRRVRRLAVTAALGCALLVPLGSHELAQAANSGASHVIHISVDGLRPDAIDNLGAGQVPNFYRLRAEGTFTDNARTDFDFTWTLPNHVSELTGRPVIGPDGHHWSSNTDPDPSETLHNNPSLPAGTTYVASVFDVAHDNGLRTGMYASKTKFSLFDVSYNGTNGAPDTTGVDNGRDKIDVGVINTNATAMTTSFLDTMNANPFDYVFVHYQQPDDAGHGSGWDPTVGSPYSNAVKAVDVQLGRIFAMIDSHPALDASNTAIVLTGDHGGGAPTANSHDDVTAAVNYTVPLYTWGAGIGPGDLYAANSGARQDPGTGRPSYAPSPQPIRNSDTANLALDLLDLPPIPGSTINAAQDLAVQGAVPATYRDLVLGDAPAAYWRLGESAGSIAADAAGSLDGTYVGSPGLKAAALIGGADPAVSFDGTNDAVTVPDSGLINLGPRNTHSIELWFRAVDVTGRQVLYEQGGGLKGAALYIDSGLLYYAAWSGSPIWPGGDVYLTTPVSAGTTYHAVFTFDQPAGTATAYLNGSAVGTGTGIGTLNSHGSDIGIGAMNDAIQFHDGDDVGNGWYFRGVIDEVAVYPDVLRAIEVADHHAAADTTSTSTSPVATIAAPSPGATVSGIVTIGVVATDPQDAPSALDVDVSVNAGASWNAATWNAGSGRHEYSWDTTTGSDGPAEIDARVTDNDGNVAVALAVVVTIQNATPSYADAVAADTPSVWWRLGESSGTSANDEVGTLDGTYAGAPGLGAGGLVGDGNSAVSFDGSNDVVEIPDSPLINEGLTSQRTLELWFRAADTNGRQVLYEEGGGLRGMAIYLDGSRLYAGAWNEADDASADTPWASGPAFVSTPVTAGAIHHVVLTLDRGSDRLEGYLNGTSIGSVSGIGLLYSHGSDIGVGAMNDAIRFHDGSDSGDGHSYAGVIDEVAIYPTALTAGQIVNHYAAGQGAGDTPPTIGFVAPADGATVSGTVTIQVTANDLEDAAGSLDVEVSTNGGASFSIATWNPAASRYELDWDTTTRADGAVTLVARATDSADQSSTANASVTVQNAAAPYADTVLGDGPSAWWRLGEGSGTSANDEVGALNGSYIGGAALGAAGLIGDANTAVTFDGVDDGVDIPDSGIVNLGSRSAHSVELWFRADEATSRQVLYEQGGTARGLAMYLDAGRVYVAGWNTVDDSSADTPWVAGPVHISTPIAAGSVHHLVLVYDRFGDRFEGFLDGARFGTVSGIGTLHSHGSDIGIGAMNDSLLFHDGGATGDGFNFNGTIDEVAVYPTALTAGQVQAHFAAGQPPGDAPPAAAFTQPTAGSTVSGTVTIQVDATDAEDPPGTLSVEVSTNGGATFADAAWNGSSQRYELGWDTDTATDGNHTLVARATDSGGNVTSTSIPVVVSNASPVYADVVLADQPSVWWRLNDTGTPVATDTVGTLDGSYVGNPAIASPGLIADGTPAVFFDGADDVVEIPDAGLINLGSRTRHTIELWFQADEVMTRQVLYEQGGTARGLVLYIDEQSVYVGGWNIIDDSSADTPWAAGPAHIGTTITPGVPHHLVLVYDQPGNRLEGFLDGVSFGAVGGVGTLHSHGSDIGIGAMNDATKFHDGNATGDGFHFGGTIDEVAVYPAALGAARIQAHYQAGAAAAPAPAPFFRAAGDCDAAGQLTRFEIENRDAESHDVVISRNGLDVIGPIAVAGGATFTTAISLGGSGDNVDRWVARWVDAAAPTRTLWFRASLCSGGLPQPARGPTALIGADCVNGVAVVDWWMLNSAPDDREMEVTLSDAEDLTEVTLWPPGGGTQNLAPGEMASGVAAIPSQFGPGDEVKVRAWWRIGDPAAHNRVSVVIPVCDL